MLRGCSAEGSFPRSSLEQLGKESIGNAAVQAAPLPPPCGHPNLIAVLRECFTIPKYAASGLNTRWKNRKSRAWCISTAQGEGQVHQRCPGALSAPRKGDGSHCSCLGREIWAGWIFTPCWNSLILIHKSHSHLRVLVEMLNHSLFPASPLPCIPAPSCTLPGTHRACRKGWHTLLHILFNIIF